MSRLLDNLVDVPMNKRKVVEVPLVKVEADERVQSNMSWHASTATQYGFKVEISFGGFAERIEEIPLLRQQARFALVESIFGEFRPMIMEVEESLWNRDFDEARRRLIALRAAMFTTGEPPASNRAG